MSSYCECGDVATIFYDDEGNELPEPICKECYYFQIGYAMENAQELFGECPAID